MSGLARARATHGTPDRFHRENFFPEGWELCVNQFLALFHRFGYIYKPLADGSWYSADERWKLTDSEILKAIACAHPRFFVGCRAGKSSRFAVLDIDANSKYHSARALKKIQRALQESGLKRTSLYRSSFSGGWHLYIFFDQPINCTELRSHLVDLLTVNDFEVAKGTLEIFPHPGQSSQGLGLRLPLQPGFAWLNKESLEVEHDRSELTATQALELFIDALDGDANSDADLRLSKSHVAELKLKRARMESTNPPAARNVVSIRQIPEKNGDFQPFVSAIFGKLPPGICPDTWYRGRLFHLNGLSGPSQRADAIFTVGHYLFYGDPSRDLPAMGYGYEQEREWAITKFLELQNNGQSKDINRGRADAYEQVERATHWVPPRRKDTEQKRYRSERPISWIRENENRKTGARNRITTALTELKKLGRSFTTVELQEAASCSRRTLYTHADIWRNDYEALAEGFFAFCTNEYNAVVGADSPEIQPPSTAEPKIVPPGLLAARRIVFEIASRSQREKDRARKAAVRSVDASEKAWRDKVALLKKESPQNLPVGQQKALLAVLLAYRSQAPTEEDQFSLQGFIDEVRETMSAVHHPKLVTGPPDT